MADWLAAGLPYDEFERRTPSEMALILRGRYAAQLADFDLQRRVAHELAQWIAFAFHQPGKIPPFEARGENALKSEAEIEAEEGRRREREESKVRAWFIGMSKARH